jgi:uncharacterized membrane protein YebE (DUF533 family)
MTSNPPNETSAETTQALLAVCTFAALADGGIADTERENIRNLAADLGGESEGMLRSILLGRKTLATFDAGFMSPSEKLLAYELALAVCEADGGINPRERAFLDELRGRLALGAEETQSAAKEVDAILLSDPAQEVAASSLAGANNDRIMRYAILNGALEILPGTLATMAILPLQMKLVYAVAKSHGITPGTSNIKEFLATLGIGVTSQFVEGFARKLLGGLGKSLGGKLAGKVANQAAGSAMSFASTYAIGHLADRYYAGGQKMDLTTVKSTMAELQQTARGLYASKAPEIQACARNINPSSIIELVRGGATNP